MFYVGYGFNVNNLNEEDLVQFMREHDPDTFSNFQEKLKDDITDGNDPDEKTMLENIWDYTQDHFVSCAAYIRDVINECECKRHNIKNDILVIYDDRYVVFDSIAFVDDCPERAKLIRSRSDFISTISRYLPADRINFDSVWTGSGFDSEPCWMEGE